VRIAARVVLSGMIADELFFGGPEEIRFKDPSTGRIVAGIRIE